MGFNFNSLWLDWRAKVPDGTPNPSNAYHLVLLKELCFKQGIDKDIIDNVILILEKDDGGLDDKEKEKAKAKGLVSKGYGNWGPEDGDTTHKNVDGKLTPIGDDDEEEKEPTKPMKIDPNPFDKEDEDDDEGGEKAEKEEPKDREKESIEDKLKGQKERYEKLGLDEKGVPTKKPENVDWSEKQGTKDPKKTIVKALDEVDKLAQDSLIMSDEEKKDFSSAIDKIKNDQVDEMTDGEISVLKNHLAVKDQSGSPDPSKRSVQFYLADVRPGDWRFGSTSDPQGGPARQARLRTKKGFGKTEGGLYYDEIQKLRKAIGLKSASPTNSRTTSKMMAPTTANKKRKDEKITAKRDSDGKVTEATIAGQTHTKKSVPKIKDVKKALMDRGMSEEDTTRSARSVVLGIQRYNDQIDLLAEAEGDLEVVDYGNVETHEGKQKAINDCLQDVANGLEKALEKTTPPHPPLTKEHYELIERIKNVENPLNDPEWENLSFEEQQKRANKFNEDMGEMLVEMNAMGDMKTSRAEVAESITYMHRLSQGFTAILPASETFKVTDVWALKDPGDTNDPNKIAESIQKILVSVEVSGGESVKYDQGARSSSAGKVSLTAYKNKGTRQSINSLLDTYDKIYKGDDYPPSDEVIKELDNVRDETKAQVVNDGIMTEEEYDKVYESGMKTGEKSFDSFLRKNKSKLEERGFTEDDLRRVKESFMKHCAQGNVMAEINNRDTEYNKFNNVAHKISGFKEDKKTGEVIKKGKYKTVEADGINVISGMNYSCDQGFKIADPPKKKVTPENTNPSAIIALDAQTGKKVN